MLSGAIKNKKMSEADNLAKIRSEQIGTKQKTMYTLQSNNKKNPNNIILTNNNETIFTIIGKYFPISLKNIYYTINPLTASANLTL